MSIRATAVANERAVCVCARGETMGMGVGATRPGGGRGARVESENAGDPHPRRETDGPP